jgi:hypothetical protein
MFSDSQDDPGSASPIRHIEHPNIASEAKLGKTIFGYARILVALVDMLPVIRSFSL